MEQMDVLKKVVKDACREVLDESIHSSKVALVDFQGKARDCKDQMTLFARKEWTLKEKAVVVAGALLAGAGIGYLLGACRGREYLEEDEIFEDDILESEE